MRPEPGAVQVAVTVLHGDGLMQEIPLTVTPLAELSGGVAGGGSEAEFRHFLKERGTPSAPRFDLNGDGRCDYLDDYIFTAYLTGPPGSFRKAPPLIKPLPPRTGFTLRA